MFVLLATIAVSQCVIVAFYRALDHDRCLFQQCFHGSRLVLLAEYTGSEYFLQCLDAKTIHSPVMP